MFQILKFPTLFLRLLFQAKVSEIEIQLMQIRLLHFENPKYKDLLKDSLAPQHPLYLNPIYQCYNLECKTCIGMAMARSFSENCYIAQHSEITLERSIGMFQFILFELNFLF